MVYISSQYYSTFHL